MPVIIEMHQGCKEESLIRITAPHFVAGATLSIIGRSRRITRVAPIIKYLKGMTPVQVQRYCVRKGWGYEWLI